MVDPWHLDNFRCLHCRSATGLAYRCHTKFWCDYPDQCHKEKVLSSGSLVTLVTWCTILGVKLNITDYVFCRSYLVWQKLSQDKWTQKFYFLYKSFLTMLVCQQSSLNDFCLSFCQLQMLNMGHCNWQTDDRKSFRGRQTQTQNATTI